MISLTSQMRIMVAVESIDFRRGIDGTSAICRQILGEDPMDGSMFVFINRSRTQIRCLYYDGQGFWLSTKRLSSGRFPHWPVGDKCALRMRAEQVFLLLRGGNPSDARSLADWHQIS